MSKGHHIRYTAAQLAFLKRRRKLPRREVHAVFVKRFRRKDVALDNIKSLYWREGWDTGRTGCFEKGIVPANKGKKMPFNANSAKTQFKKGGLPANTKYLGHERVTKDNYVEISVDQTNPHTGYERRYVLKHRWLWEKLHGPVPTGMCLKCKTDRLNTDPSNWELIPRAMLPRLNGRFGRNYDAAPAELKPVMLAIVKLEHQVRKRKAS